jgi:hypothetical protein
LHIYLVLGCRVYRHGFFLPHLPQTDKEIANAIIYCTTAVDLVPIIIGWVRLYKQDNTRFANLWGWSLAFSLHCFNIYASILLKHTALVNTQLFGVFLSFTWLALIMRIRLKYNEPVGLPLYLVLKLIKCIKKCFIKKWGKKNWGKKKNLMSTYIYEPPSTMRRKKFLGFWLR